MVQSPILQGFMPATSEGFDQSKRLRLMWLDLENGKQGFPVNIVSIELRPHSARRYPGTFYLKPVSTFTALIKLFAYTPAD
jgi:hypothetical protein